MRQETCFVKGGKGEGEVKDKGEGKGEVKDKGEGKGEVKDKDKGKDKGKGNVSPPLLAVAPPLKKGGASQSPPFFKGDRRGMPLMLTFKNLLFCCFDAA